MGNTPACAGKTESRRTLHPASETPPLARGRRAACADDHRAVRNTPACAGKTHPRRACRAERGKHPRLRGEDNRKLSRFRQVTETPPLARGRHCFFLSLRRLARNTPACAGKTRFFRSRNRDRRKHPRLRGEDSGTTVQPASIQETPPLARGRRFSNEPPVCGCGNTPACAGKTWIGQQQSIISKKHPRLRGEDDSRS